MVEKVAVKEEPKEPEEFKRYLLPSDFGSKEFKAYVNGLTKGSQITRMDSAQRATPVPLTNTFAGNTILGTITHPELLDPIHLLRIGGGSPFNVTAFDVTRENNRGLMTYIQSLSNSTKNGCCGILVLSGLQSSSDLTIGNDTFGSSLTPEQRLRRQDQSILGAYLLHEWLRQRGCADFRKGRVEYDAVVSHLHRNREAAINSDPIGPYYQFSYWVNTMLACGWDFRGTFINRNTTNRLVSISYHPPQN